MTFARSDGVAPGMWGLVMWPTTTDVKLPFRLADGLTLERPPELVRVALSERIVALQAFSSTGNPFELERVPEAPPSTSFRLVPVANPADLYLTLHADWTYEDTPAHDRVALAASALRLLDKEIRIGLTAQAPPQEFPVAVPWHATDLVGIQDVAVRMHDLELHASDLDLASDLVDSLLALSVREGYEPIQRAVRLFVELDSLARMSSLWQLGHFIVWEALLTHDPSPTDPQDSLTKQLRMKIPLLGGWCES